MRLHPKSLKCAEDAYVADLGRPFEGSSLRQAIRAYVENERIGGHLVNTAQSMALLDALVAAAGPAGMPEWPDSGKVVKCLHSLGFEIREKT